MQSGTNTSALPAGHDGFTVLVVGELTGQPDYLQLELAARFYGFSLCVAPTPAECRCRIRESAGGKRPILLVVSASRLDESPIQDWQALLDTADGFGIPVALIGIAPNCSREIMTVFSGGNAVEVVAKNAKCGLWVSAVDSNCVGFELRGLRLGLGSSTANCLVYQPEPGVKELATVGISESDRQPAMIRITRANSVRYLLASIIAPNSEAGETWSFRRSYFGEIVPLFLLIREAGGERCWQAPEAFANLTIDDPWLTEPYGSLSFPGLLAEMRRERFHTTIGFVPWNYDRSRPEVVTLFRGNPEYYSIAVHGNNHDRYEFFRYQARPDDNQRSKPLAEQAINIRQAAARMEEFSRLTGLDYDRVMVFPHGVCPGPTFNLLKQTGFWATSNYSNVPLDERPPDDPVITLRSANANWGDLPGLRRMYPHDYSDESIGVDLFLGNPVLYMAHQDTFFGGIDAFNSHAKRVNSRQPAVRWTGLGEISRHLHLQRWLDGGCCEVRLVSHHARINNPKSAPVEFRFSKREPNAGNITSVTCDGINTAWNAAAGEIQFNITLPANTSGLVEIKYQWASNIESVDLRRRGLRNHVLRLISDFRDLTLPRSALGRFLTRKYYLPGKKRATLSTLLRHLVQRHKGGQ